MARGRMISCAIATDEDFNNMSVDAQFLFMRAVPHLDRDGLFGELYTEPHNIRAVIAMYRERVGCDYRTAWADWFDWALGLPSRRETVEMLKNLEIG